MKIPRQFIPPQRLAITLPALTYLLLCTILFSLPSATAGPFAPPAGQPGSTAIDVENTNIVGWATAVTDYSPGPGVVNTWTNTQFALGPSTGSISNIVSLGRGSITLTFDQVIEDRPGPDFAVFENGFAVSPELAFLELAFVEVSSDGTNFVRFPATSLSPRPPDPSVVTNFLNLDATNLDGLAGKYTRGFGTPFDIADLNVDEANTTFNSNAVTHLRVVDIVGDGTTLDQLGNPIYDQTPTVGSVGFDLEAVAVLQAPPRIIPPPPFVLEVFLTRNQRGFVLETTTQPGVHYVVESKGELVAGGSGEFEGWTRVLSFTATKTNQTFAIDTASPAQFWRVRTDPDIPPPEMPTRP